MKLVTQILILALTPLLIVLGHNLYQSFYLKQTLESQLSNSLDEAGKVSLEYLLRQQTLAKQVGELLVSSPTAVEALHVRDSVALHELGAQIVQAGLIDSVVFIDSNGYIAARSDSMYHFNDTIQNQPIWIEAKKNQPFIGIINFDLRAQITVLLPIFRYQTDLTGYVLVSHFLDKEFMKVLHQGEVKALLNTDANWLPSKYTHHRLIEPNLTTLNGEKYSLHVWQDSSLELDFIKSLFMNQNLIIAIMMVLFLGLIIWVANGITRPLRELGAKLGAFAKGELTLHELTHALSPKRQGKSEVSALIDGVLAALRNLALAHQSFESSKEHASQSEARARALIEETLSKLRVPLLCIELHHDVENRSPQTIEALRVMHAIVDNMQTKLDSNNTSIKKACVVEILEEKINLSAKEYNIDLHVKGIDKLPEILYIDQERWSEFFDVLWNYLRDFLAAKAQIQMEWKYNNQTLRVQIISPTHAKALHLLAQASKEDVLNLDAIVRLHVSMFVYLGAKFETIEDGIQILTPLTKTATIKATQNQSPL